MQNVFLNTLRRDRIPVSIFLVNGVRMGGHIQSFDQFSIRLSGEPPQLILKHVVATIVPEKFVRPGKGPESARARPLRGKPPENP